MNRESVPRGILVIPSTGYQEIAGLVPAFEGSLNFRNQIDFTAKRHQRRTRIIGAPEDPSSLLTRQRMPQTPRYERLDVNDIDPNRVTTVYKRNRGDYTDDELQTWAYNILGPNFRASSRSSLASQILSEIRTSS